MSMQHDRLKALVTRLVEGAVSEAERVEIESHLASCSECQSAWEAERKTREALLQETKAFAEGYDAGRLEANLAHELRSGAISNRWVLVLAVLFAVLTGVFFVRPIASQPDAWTATLPLALACLGTFYWGRRKLARFVAIARAAEEARGGFRDLERARVLVNVREFRTCGRLGMAVAAVVPTLVALTGILTRVRLRHAFPTADINVNLLRSLVSPMIIAAFLLLGGLYLLREARRLEASVEKEWRGSDPPN